MTWREFKDQVDQQIAEQGYDDSIEVQYIDWCGGQDVDAFAGRDTDVCGHAMTPTLRVT